VRTIPDGLGKGRTAVTVAALECPAWPATFRRKVRHPGCRMASRLRSMKMAGGTDDAGALGEYTWRRRDALRGTALDSHPVLRLDCTLPPAFPFIHRLVHGYALLYRSEAESMARLLAIEPPLDRQCCQWAGPRRILVRAGPAAGMTRRGHWASAGQRGRPDEASPRAGGRAR
jgi:hypothetical protein